MMDATLHLMIEQLKEMKSAVNAGQEELKTEMNAVNAGQEELKTEMNAVNAGQEELKTEMNAVSAGQEELKNDRKSEISALETKINAGQEELRQEISAFQERIKAGQAEFEERVTCTVNTQLKNVSSMVEQQARNLRADLSRNIEATRQDVEATRRDLEATQRDFETQLAALEAQTRRAGGGNAGANADKVKPPKFDGSTSWAVFHRQFEAAAVHNDWTPREKVAHLLSVLQGQAVDILHRVVSQPKRRMRTSLGCCKTDSETTSWRRLTGHTLRPGCRRVVRHCRSSPRPSSSWRTGHSLDFLSATFRRKPPTRSSMEYGTGK
jgi:hypothetical protein